MDDYKLHKLIRQASPRTWERAPPCPDEHEIAAYVDGTIAAPAREAVEFHLADCERCTLLVGALSRLEIETGDEASALTLARAQRLVSAGSSRWASYLPHLAAAAVLMLAVGILFNARQDAPVQAESDYRATRSATTSPELAILAPDSGAGVQADELEVRWTAMPDIRYYLVRVVTGSGALVTEQRVTEAEWRPGGDVVLEAGRDYYVRVEAFPTVGAPVGSMHVPFTVRAVP
jgi:hypothetical protein